MEEPKETELKDKKIEAEKLEVIYREYWEHARQCVNERLWFTNIYAVILAAIMVFLGETGSSESTNFVSAFLMASFGFILSVIGFQVVVTLSLGYDHYINDITMILYYWDKMEFYRRPKKPVIFRNVHRRLFQFAIALFVALSLYYASGATAALGGSRVIFLLGLLSEHWSFPMLTFLIIFLIIEVLYYCRWEKFSRECSRFREALQYDFKGIFREEWSGWFKNPRGGKKAIRAEEIRKRVIEKAVERKILLSEKKCQICRILDCIFNGLYCIWDAFYRIVCGSPGRNNQLRQ